MCVCVHVSVSVCVCVCVCAYSYYDLNVDEWEEPGEESMPRCTACLISTAIISDGGINLPRPQKREKTQVAAQ